MGVIPYTNAIAAYTRSPTFAVVAGSGTQGLIMVGQPGIKTFADMRGKRVGTFQADTLDILVYDYLKKQGMTYKDIKMQYLGNSVELTNAFIAGQLDVMSAIEPYATRGLMATKGHVLGDGVDMYGTGLSRLRAHRAQGADRQGAEGGQGRDPRLLRVGGRDRAELRGGGEDHHRQVLQDRHDEPPRRRQGPAARASTSATRRSSCSGARRA